MNPFATSETLNIDGILVNVPVLSSQNDNSRIVFEKPNWMPDSETDSCLGCCAKFTQLRRKHHCRNCGKIFCSKCCSRKMCLPHFGINVPEKVCTGCELIAELMVKAMSDDVTERYDAVIGLSSLTKNLAGLCKVVGCGGIHVIIFMAHNGGDILRGAVASAIHNIAQSMVLNSLLIEAGALKILKNILVTASRDQYEILSDSLNAMNLFCCDKETRVQVLNSGIIDALLDIITYQEILSILAARVLHLLISNFDYHEFILEKHSNVVPCLLTALQIEDYQLQASILRMLVFLSAGNETFRRLLIQEDAIHNSPILYLLKGSPPGVLTNAVCTAANLSLSMDQNYAHQYISGMCELLDVINEESSEILIHLGRGLANFSECPASALHLLQHLNSITSSLLKSNFEVHKVHACRIIVNLLSHEPSCTLDVLSRNGIDIFIDTVFALPGIVDVMNNLLLRKVSKLSILQS